MDPNRSYRWYYVWRLILPLLLLPFIGYAAAAQLGFNPLPFVAAGLILGAVIARQMWRIYRAIPAMQPGEYTARRGAYMASAAFFFASVLFGVFLSSSFGLPEIWGGAAGGLAGLLAAFRINRLFNQEIDREFGDPEDS